MSNETKNAYEDLADDNPSGQARVNPKAFNVDINKVISFEEDVDTEEDDPGYIPSKDQEEGLKAEIDTDGNISHVDRDGNVIDEPGQNNAIAENEEESEEESDDDEQERSSGSASDQADTDNAEKEEGQNQEDLQKKYQDYSESALIALSEVKEGYFPIEEDKIPKDLNAYQLKNLYRLRYKQELEQATEQISSRAEEAQEFVKYLIEGGDPNVVKNALTDHELVQLDIEDEANQRKILKAHMLKKDMPKEDVDEFVETIFDRGKNKERAQQAQEFFKQQEKNAIKEAEQRQKQLDEQRAEQEKAYNQTLNALIEKGEIGGVKLNDGKKEQLRKDMFEPTEVLEFTHPQTGEKQRVRATKNQVLQQKIQNDPEMFLAFNLWLSQGGSFDFAKKQAQKENDDEMRALLEGRTNSTRKKEKLKPSGNAWDDLAEW